MILIRNGPKLQHWTQTASSNFSKNNSANLSSGLFLAVGSKPEPQFCLEISEHFRPETEMPKLKLLAELGAKLLTDPASFKTGPRFSGSFTNPISSSG